jgi:hypothetical protein
VLHVSEEGLPLAEAEPNLRTDPKTASAADGHAVSAVEERLSPSELSETSRLPLAARIAGGDQRAAEGADSGMVE